LARQWQHRTRSWLSSTLRDLVIGSRLEFEDRGLHDLNDLLRSVADAQAVMEHPTAR